MSTATKTLLQSNVSELSFTGAPVDVEPSLGNTNAIHTVSYSLRDFTGRVSIQGTLSDTPADSDWFDIETYSEFTDRTGTIGITFRANLKSMRIKVDRSYLPETEYDSETHGIIEKAYVNV